MSKLKIADRNEKRIVMKKTFSIIDEIKDEFTEKEN